MHQHIADPHQVEYAGRERHRLGETADEADRAGGDVVGSPRQVVGDGLEAASPAAGAPVQLDQLRAVPATNVENGRSGAEPQFLGAFEEQVRTARVQARVQDAAGLRTAQRPLGVHLRDRARNHRRPRPIRRHRITSRDHPAPDIRNAATDLGNRHGCRGGPAVPKWSP
jgi:hypothetical protein